jgi:MTH538 TIR-like domain (DUF1863)
MTKSVFYSFYYNHDFWRVQQVIQMGAVENQKILNAQKWEEVKRQGDSAIKKWITDQMACKSAVVVLVGSQTANRPWVKHEITHAWGIKKPLVGIRIHGLADDAGNQDKAGANPFSQVTLPGGQTVSDYVPLHTPGGTDSQAVHANIKKCLMTWVDDAYQCS